VVADEVRNLAQRSATAARETASKIESAIANTQQGVVISGKVAQSLQEIVKRAREVDELAELVASASKDQSQNISQVNIAVSQMDEITQRTAANAEESASAAQQLLAQAESIKRLSGELTRLVSSQAQQPDSGNDQRKRGRRVDTHSPFNQTKALTHKS
jgi:methyl-accepting chemotaxis protein